MHQEVKSDILSVDEGAKQLDSDYEKGVVHGITELDIIEESRGGFRGFLDGFKAPQGLNYDNVDGLSRIDVANVLVARSKPKLKKRHLRMISLCSCLGTGLLIGTGNGLKHGGPAAVVIGYTLIGLIAICTMFSLGELGVRYPARGSFTDYITRFVDESWGFACSYLYLFGWLVVMPLEIIAAAMCIQYWKDDDNPAARVNPVAWTPIYFVAIIAINVFGTRVYGEVEFLCGACKVLALVGFIIFGLVIVNGGGPNGIHYADSLYYDPGAFANGFKGVVSTLVSCAFALGGSAEISGIAAAETQNPRKSLPSAVKQVIWRVVILFVLAPLLVGLIVPYTHPSLGTSGDGSGSPFVIAFKVAGVRGLPSVFNAVIMISVFSVGVSATFLSANTLLALSLRGQAPQYFSFIDRKGRPMHCFYVVWVFGLLAFTCASSKYKEVFDWLYAFASLSFLYIWGSTCLAYIRVFRAMQVQGIPRSDLVYRSVLGRPGAWIGLILTIAVLGLQFWTSASPLGREPSAEYFFQQDVSIPFVIFLFIAHKIWTRKWMPVKIKDMDISSNLREFDPQKLEEEIQEERQLRNSNWFRRISGFLC